MCLVIKTAIKGDFRPVCFFGRRYFFNGFLKTSDFKKPFGVRPT